MPDRTVRLADAMNTYNHALAALRTKGYHLYVVPDERPDEFGAFWAIKDRRDFIASDPLRLLGLVALWEQFGDTWRASSVDDIYWELSDLAFTPEHLSTVDDVSFAALVEHLAILCEALDIEMPEQIDRQTLIRLLQSLGTTQEEDASS